MSALEDQRTLMEAALAEIRVAPQRRTRGIVWILVAVIVVATVAWYFLAGPGTGVATGA